MWSFINLLMESRPRHQWIQSSLCQRAVSELENSEKWTEEKQSILKFVGISCEPVTVQSRSISICFVSIYLNNWQAFGNLINKPSFLEFFLKYQNFSLTFKVSFELFSKISWKCRLTFNKVEHIHTSKSRANYSK